MHTQPDLSQKKKCGIGLVVALASYTRDFALESFLVLQVIYNPPPLKLSIHLRFVFCFCPFCLFLGCFGVWLRFFSSALNQTSLYSNYELIGLEAHFGQIQFTLRYGQQQGPPQHLSHFSKQTPWAEDNDVLSDMKPDSLYHKTAPSKRNLRKLPTLMSLSQQSAT